MALIIKGDLPCNCMDYCQFCGNDMVCKLTGEEISSYDGQFGRMDFCPLVEIPDVHGRLVDADKILTESGYNPNMFKPKHTKDNDYQQYDTLMGYEILGIIEDAPTVVEATT